MVKKTAIFFVVTLVVLYFVLTYSYAGYRPEFPEETKMRKFINGPGYVLETDSIADRATVNKEICGVNIG